MSEIFDIRDVSVGVRPTRMDTGEIAIAIIFVDSNDELISFKFPLHDATKILAQFEDAVEEAELQLFEEEDETS